MTEACEKILFAESESERELLCQALFGKPFGECVDDLRREDFLRGIDDGRYVVLQAQLASGAGSRRDAVEVSFTSRSYDRRVCALYEAERQPMTTLSLLENCSMPSNQWIVPNQWIIPGPGTFRITLPGEDAPRVFEKIRELQNPETVK